MYALSTLSFLPGGDGQNQNQSNLIKAERLIFEHNPSLSTIIVGSSLSYRLSARVIGPGVFNFSLGGETQLTGLEILIRSGIVPKVLLVETNILTKKSNEPFVDSLFHPLAFSLKKMFPFLREEFQPTTVLHSIIRRRWGRTDGERLAVKPDQRVFEQLLLNQLETYCRFESEAFQRGQIDHLFSMLGNFDLKKTKIFLIQMPIDPQLRSLPRNQSLQNELKIRANARNYAWIQPPSDESFDTTDGIHLSNDAAARYSAFLAQQLVP